MPDFGWEGLYRSVRSMTFWPPKGKSLRSKEKKIWTADCWTFRGQYLKTCHLRFFLSENKKCQKNCLDSETVLKNYYILIFDCDFKEILFFFWNLIKNQWNEPINQKILKGKSCQKFNFKCQGYVTADLVEFGMVWFCNLEYFD